MTSTSYRRIYIVMKDIIDIAKRAQKDLRKVPKHIVRNFQRWAMLVKEIGIIEVRKIKGYHDEPLVGNLAGQRSVRLSKAYRAIYIEALDGPINIVTVTEVNKHEY